MSYLRWLPGRADRGDRVSVYILQNGKFFSIFEKKFKNENQCILEHYEDELDCPVCGTISHPTTPEKYLIKDEVLSQVINEIIPRNSSNHDSKSPPTSTSCNVIFIFLVEILICLF